MSPVSRALGRYAAAAGWAALSTGVAEVLFRFTGSTRLSMVFLAGVMLTAFFQGAGPAYLTAALAFFIYNFYLVEPRFTFKLEAEDVINLVVFLAVAMLTGSLTGRVRDQAARAEARARSTDTLFRATREFAALSDEATIRERLAHHLAAAAEAPAFVKDGPRLFAQVEPQADTIRRAEALEARDGEAAASVAADGWTLRPLRTAGLNLGVAGWDEDSGRPLSDDERKLVEILADAGAGALGRARLAADKADAEARARTEDLRNALLSSISHDLRTPLAAIMASATSLQEFGDSFDAGVRKDLATTIQEEAERLDSFVANLLNMTRLEAGALALQKTTFSVAEVVRRTVQRRGRESGRILTSMDPELPEAVGDPVLFEQALGNVVENALRYAPADSPLLVSVRAAGGRILTEVADHGPGVPAEDLARIFEKFYRGASSGRKPGTGLGLSIARGLMEAMDGDIEASNRQGAAGLVVTLSLGAA